MVRLIAFDLDRTLTQHKSKLGVENRQILDTLRAHYHLLMVGAGTCMRIWNQMEQYPIDIIGCYGMQYATYDPQDCQLHMVWNESADVNREEILRRAGLIRDRFDLHAYAGETMEFHETGALTFPCLGTKAQIADKLAYDPDRAKRRVMYPYVKELFSDYNTVIGGSSSFDFTPGNYGKCNALRRYMKMQGLGEQEVVYCGDDYYEGGNDYDVFSAGIPFVKVDDYTKLGETLRRSGLMPDT